MSPVYVAVSHYFRLTGMETPLLKLTASVPTSAPYIAGNFHSRIKNILSDMDLHFISVCHSPQRIIPPWSNHPLRIDTRLAQLVNSNTRPEAVKIEFRAILSSYEYCDQKDESKSQIDVQKCETNNLVQLRSSTLSENSFKTGMGYDQSSRKKNSLSPHL